ncbi:hypothetical protein BV25DRAFT_1915839 [Artomyces pyxidatus]|uniref:Uncharacterized protein n=1 Tax=Artomyces pyxidatus TaxID=48021 RepID=A0ACB8T3J3_9AGAM|nr:hypothetical protein BV25DRAFT_1915839 [Artomyces pyxidatus]
MAAPPFTSSTSSSGTIITPGTTLFWTPLNHLFTCGQAKLTWGHVGPSVSMSLVVTNVGVVQQAPAGPPNVGSPAVPRSNAETTATPERQSGYGGSFLQSVFETLSKSVDSSSGNYTWPSVDVPQGWYQMQAILPNSTTTITISAPFFVTNGTNTSCIRAADDTPSSFNITSTSPSSSPTSSTVSISSSSSAVSAIRSSHSHAGGIAGGVFGGIACLSMVLAALAYRIRRRRQSQARLAAVYGVEIGGDKWACTSIVQTRERQGRERVTTPLQSFLILHSRKNSTRETICG